MARHEREVYEGGKDRRKAERRSGDRRRSGRMQAFIKYAAVAIVTLLVIKILHL